LPSSLYLIVREKKNLSKVFWGVLVFGVLWGFVFDFLETFNKAWIVGRLVFSQRIFGILPVDDIIGYALMTLFVIIFYEHFLDKSKGKSLSGNLIWGILPFLLVVICILVFFPFYPDLFKIPFVYLLGGFIAVIPTAVMIFYKPDLLPRFFKIAAFFFLVWFTSEFIALKTGGWYFPGQYIGEVKIFGVAFPFEELFFWMMLYASSISAYYEFFLDDLK
ncbi:MAG: hypothetical protein NTW60_03705, partial [Candidatus Wolfebacteria bacterium]|nr:hypothetical protein [Candidatus Wolfebacteria bacterium]